MFFAGEQTHDVLTRFVYNRLPFNFRDHVPYLQSARAGEGRREACVRAQLHACVYVCIEVRTDTHAHAHAYICVSQTARTHKTNIKSTHTERDRARARERERERYGMQADLHTCVHTERSTLTLWLVMPEIPEPDT